MDDKTVSSLTIGVTFALLVFLALSVAVSKVLFKYSERKCKWVKRQCKFLDAILFDLEKVSHSVEQIKGKANQIRGSDKNNLEGTSRSLKEIDVTFRKKADDLLQSAWPVVKEFEGLSMTQKLLMNRFVADFINFLPTIDNAMDMKRTAREIEEHVRDQSVLAKKTCDLLEQTRERVRSLQDRPMGRTGNEFLGPKFPFNPEVGFALERLTGMGQNSIRGKLADEVRLAVMKVKLVQALVKDLRWVKLESRIENAWLSEVVDVIENAERSIFAASAAEERMVRWPVALGLRNWYARRNIGRRIAYFDNQFSDLLKATSRYGIGFLRRESKKNVRRRRLQRSGGSRDVPTILAGIRIWITEESQRRLCDDLESLERVLKEEGAFYAREACFELLKSTAMEVENRVRERGGVLEASELDRIDAVVKLLKEMVPVCSVKVMDDPCSTVGFEEDVHRLVSVLVALSTEGSGDKPTVLSIVGTQGIGKTTLAKEIMNHTCIISHFKIRMVTFSDQGADCDETGLMESVGQKIFLTKKLSGDKDFWVREIRQFLTTQACLVVLDDLPSKQAWNVLKEAFPSESNSVLVLTTGSKEVSELVNPSKDSKRTHRMRLRTEMESWEFFTQLVNFPTDADAVTKSLAKRVVARTGGLPLAIMHLGYLLFGKDLNKEELRKVLDRDHIAHDQWSRTWHSNKKDFQSRPDLTKCFSYSELFPADFDIPTRRLLALWVASGSVQSSEDAMKRLHELVECNMIQMVERKCNGEIKTCRFPSTLREIWVRDTRNEAARARSWSLFASHNHQLAYRFDDQDTGAARSVHGLNSNIVLQQEKYPRSIMFFDTSDGNKPNEDIGNFLLKGTASSHRQFRELLVLDLEGVFRPQLPHSIGQLKKLTYLGLRWTFIETIPESIGKLFQLQTLDLKHTYVKTLPPSTWKLKSLRHLYLSENCRIKQMPTLSSSSMKSLQTLSGVFLDHEGSALSSGLDKLLSLRKLGVTISQLPLKQQNLLGTGIAQLTNLRSLSLRSINENGEPREMKLKSLSGLTSLTSLYLLGKLENSSVLSDLPQSLTELTLSASELGADPVPMLAKLCRLKFLSLLAKASMETHMVFRGENFPELLVLQIWSQPNLESLEVSLGAMPKLREFEIRNCNKLRTTKGLIYLKTLQELKLTNMVDQEQVIENEFVAAKENSWRQIVHCPSITKKMRKLLRREARNVM